MDKDRQLQPKEDFAAFVGSIPENYDRGLGPVMFADCARIMAGRAAALAPGRLLETAAGSGIVTRALRDQLPGSTALTATDLNADMLAVAARKIAAGEAVTLEPADAQNLPYADGAFDCVVCQFGVMFYPDKDRSYREAFRVLRPGGHYLFSFWDAVEFNPFARIWRGIMLRLFPDDPPPFVPFEYRFDAAKASLLAAGFDGIEASVVRLSKEIASPPALARGLACGSPATITLDARGQDKEAVVAMATEALIAELGTDPCRTDLQAIFVAARRPD
ncbi:MAG: class I SAM-dependent methyltransferase [Ferrovibrionaceae bacterium]